MIDTFLMQARRSDVPASCKVFFPCNERSGKQIRSSKSGVILQPDNPPYDGSIAFTDPYGITITNGVSAGDTEIYSGSWPSFDLSKVIISAVFGKTATDPTAFKMPMGKAGTSAGFTMSVQSGMHTLLQSDSGQYIAIPPDVSKAVNGDTEIIAYVMWDGITGTLSSKVLNPDGTQYVNGVAVAQTTASGQIATGTMTPSSVCRMGAITLRQWAVWELDAVPTNLPAKLASMHKASSTGVKGAYRL